MRNLLWKEWREQSWKLGFASVVLGAMVLIGLRARIVSDESMTMWTCYVGLLLLPILASTGLLPAERSEGSFESLLAMPIAPWRILLAKTLLGALLCAGPLLVAAITSIAIAGGREMPVSGFATLYGRSILTALSLLMWMMALTARLPTEARAGLIGMGVQIIWELATAGLAAPWGTTEHGPSPAIAASPLAFVYGFSDGFEKSPRFVFVLVTQAALAGALWYWTKRQIVVVDSPLP